MTREELEMYEDYDTPYHKWWLPTLWILGKIRESRDKGAFHPSVYRSLVCAVEDWRSGFQKMLDYDWVPLPLVYTQVLYFVTHWRSQGGGGGG